MLSLLERKSLHFLVLVFSLTTVNLVAQTAEQSINPIGFTLKDKKRNVRQNEVYENNELKLKVIEAYKKEISASPGNALLHNNLGAAFAEMGNYQEAIISLQKAVEINPKLANAHYNLAVVYERQNLFPEAFAAIEKAVVLNGSNVSIRVEKCQILLGLENFKDAIPCHEILFQMRQPNARERTNYAIALLYTEEFDKAFTVLKENIEMFSTEAITHNALGMALFKKKKYKQSVPHFTRAVELDFKLDPARYNLALAQLMVRDRDSALKQYAFLKNSNSDFAAQLYKYLFSSNIIQVNN